MREKYYFLINSLEWWGAERVTVNLAKNYINKWKAVYIITLKSDKFYDVPIWVTLLSLSKVNNNLCMSLLIPWYAIKLKRVLKKYNIEDGISLLEIANFVHILAKKNAIISFRTHINFFTWFVWMLYKALIKYLYPKAQKIIVNSYENKYDLAEYLKVSEDKIDVLYNPVDHEKISTLKNEKIEAEVLEKIKNRRVFITTWRLIGAKNHKKILEALCEYKLKKHEERIYLIVGDWPERNKLENMVKKCNLVDNVLFLWQQKNVFKYLHKADLFLYASEVEGFPNVLLEARELWIPIVTSDFKSGAKEVIIWNYDNSWKNITYPYKGSYGTLIDLENYQNQLLELL